MISIIISALSGRVLAEYGVFRLETLFSFILFFIIYVSNQYGKERELDKKGKLGLSLYSGLFSVILILGYHIHVESGYGGLKDVNYITAYSLWDLISFPFLFWGIYNIIKALYLFLQTKKNFLGEGVQFSLEKKISWKQMLIVCSLLFVTWFPYFLTYYPGFIYADTMDSIRQAVREAWWSNQHPFFILYLLRNVWKSVNDLEIIL